MNVIYLECCKFGMLAKVTRLGRFISILSRNFPWAVEVCQKIQCNWWEQVVLSRSTLAVFIHTLPLQATKCMGRGLIRKNLAENMLCIRGFLCPFFCLIIPVIWEDVSTYSKYWQIDNDFCSFVCMFFFFFFTLLGQTYTPGNKD